MIKHKFKYKLTLRESLIFNFDMSKSLLFFNEHNLIITISLVELLVKLLSIWRNRWSFVNTLNDNSL